MTVEFDNLTSREFISSEDLDKMNQLRYLFGGKFIDREAPGGYAGVFIYPIMEFGEDTNRLVVLNFCDSKRVIKGSLSFSGTIIEGETPKPKKFKPEFRTDWQWIPREDYTNPVTGEKMGRKHLIITRGWKYENRSRKTKQDITCIIGDREFTPDRGSVIGDFVESRFYHPYRTCLLELGGDVKDTRVLIPESEPIPSRGVQKYIETERQIDAGDQAVTYRTSLGLATIVGLSGDGVRTFVVASEDLLRVDPPPDVRKVVYLTSGGIYAEATIPDSIGPTSTLGF